MGEPMRSARHEGASRPTGGGVLRLLPPASRLSLRVKGVDEARAGRADARHGRSPEGADGPDDALAVMGLPLAVPINSCALSGGRILARLGPDEWLLLGPEGGLDAMAEGVAAGLASRFHAAVDVSQRSVAFELSGASAAAILNAGCPLDLHRSAFPPDSATRTILGKAEIVLLRPGEAPVFRVECWRSFAPYMHDLLAEAARDM